MAGKNLAATWHNRPLTQTLQVKAGQVVTLKLHAKAATPPDFTPPKRLGNDTPAHRASARLKRGVNLGNGWEAPPDKSWGVHFTTADIDSIAAEGFDHIRETLDAARAWSLYFGRPIHLGEFGSHFPADHASRARYLRDVRTLTEARSIPWTLWEWKAGFGYWNPQNNQARFRNSLFE